MKHQITWVALRIKNLSSSGAADVFKALLKLPLPPCMLCRHSAAERETVGLSVRCSRRTTCETSSKEPRPTRNQPSDRMCGYIQSKPRLVGE
ncbi:unnamed protein product [Pleuronectes platessa]|uniref:Uncharacterized protein n=1 Tax=Pleuronectes platessa TaxID=8262 RepID=A0A9N7VKV7_PLEPL|nr:unnamed protein product [Pleuronectes platessa]